MGNLFDNLQDKAFSVVTNMMGYDATWTPADNTVSPQTGRVLYKGPTEKEKLLSADFEADKLTMEYKYGTFIGLEAETKSNGKFGVIKIDGLNGLWVEFYIRSIMRKWDGNTFEARLEFKAVGDFNPQDVNQEDFNT